MPGSIVFVYFRASLADDGRIAAQLGTLQANIRGRLGGDALARFGHRRQEAPGQRTWLESYEIPPEADPASLIELRIELATSAGLDALLAAPAHIEVFEMQGDASCA